MISATKIGWKNEKSKRKSKKIFVFSHPKKAVFPKKTPLFLKIFGENVWYYENTIYLCNVKIIINGQNKITKSWKN